RIIELARPKIIIVSNTKARGFFISEAMFTIGFNEEIGTDVIINEGSILKNTPIFFTSMLSGQRALDKGSFRRLIWHINFVLNSKFYSKSVFLKM
ncbi:MAG: hypothetical protein ABUL44_05020, partial [Flavobacterium sp.]